MRFALKVIGLVATFGGAAAVTLIGLHYLISAPNLTVAEFVRTWWETISLSVLMAVIGAALVAAVEDDDAVPW